MKDTISRFLRLTVLAILALVGMGMALIFMISTAIAVGVLYIVARLRGQPFGIRTYWARRQAARPKPFQYGKQHFSNQDAIDVEVREVR